MGRKKRSRREKRSQSPAAAASEKQQRRTFRLAAVDERIDHPTYYSVAVVALIAAMVAVIYGQTRAFGFISLDDPQYVTANPVVRGGLTGAGIQWALTTGTFYWHPLTWMSHMLDVSLFGVSAGPAHLVNASIHLLNSILVFVTFRKLTSSFWKSGIVAVAFAVHPLHVESVAWIAERKDVLSTFFWFATTYVYTEFATSGSRRKLVGATVLFALGLLAKPMIVTLPFVLLLLDYWPLDRLDDDKRVLHRWWPLIREKLAMLLLAAASIAVTVLSQRGSGAVVAVARLSLPERLGNALVSYCLYLRDLVWPFRLAPFYPLQPPSTAEIAGALLLLLSLTMLAWRIGRDLRFVIVGWLWYLGTLVPVIGFVQAGDQGRADRFMYVPMIGLLIIACWGIERLIPTARRTHTAAFAVAMGTLVGLMLLARKQAEYWRDDLTLWARTVSVTHDNYRAQNMYGVALTDRGLLVQGISHYLAALEIWPDYPEAHNNLGTARRDEGRTDDAIAEFTKAVQLKPNSSSFHFNLGVVYSDKGDTSSAIREVETAIRLDPAAADYKRALDILKGIRRE